MRKLLVYQSAWAMERRRPDGLEWTRAEKLTRVQEAGFEGYSINLGTEAQSKEAVEIMAFLHDHGMGAEAQVFPETIEALKPVVEEANRLGAHHIDVQPNVRPQTVEECLPFLASWESVMADSDIPVFIETHRDRMTTDLHFTLQLLDHFPDLPLTADLSHYFVGREFAVPVGEEHQKLIRRILDNAGNFHGRVASREQVQISIGFPQHQQNVELFKSWWAYGFRSWRKRAADDAELVFLCELGPPEYAITGPDGYELSDRWEDSQTMMQMARDLWAKSEE